MIRHKIKNKQSISPYTSFLFTKPGILSGIAGIIDWAGLYTQYNNFDSSEEADFKVLEADWLAVRDDLQKSFVKIILQDMANEQK